jgi:hypothetical protein
MDSGEEEEEEERRRRLREPFDADVAKLPP